MESKILDFLKVTPDQRSRFSDKTKQFVKLLDGLQMVYYKSPESANKEKLGLTIVQLNNQLMAYLKGEGMGIYSVSAPVTTPPPVVTAPPTQASTPPSQQPQPQRPQPPQPARPEPPQPQPEPQPEPPQSVTDDIKKILNDYTFEYHFPKYKRKPAIVIKYKIDTSEVLKIGGTNTDGFELLIDGKKSNYYITLIMALQAIRNGEIEFELSRGYIVKIKAIRDETIQSQPEPQPQPQPQPEPPQRDLEQSIRDLERAIKGLDILAKSGNENAKKAVAGLKIIKRRYESQLTIHSPQLPPVEPPAIDPEPQVEPTPVREPEPPTQTPSVIPISQEVDRFIEKLNQEYGDENTEYSGDRGSSYYKIIYKSFGSKSAWGFVALKDNQKKGERIGDLLKAASWNAPAKVPRGNILDGTAKYDKYSPAYLK